MPWTFFAQIEFQTLPDRSCAGLDAEHKAKYAMAAIANPLNPKRKAAATIAKKDKRYKGSDLITRAQTDANTQLSSTQSGE